MLHKDSRSPASLVQCCVGCTYLCWLREWKGWEGLFRRSADGSDIGDYLITDYTDMSLLFYHVSVRRNKGMCGNTEISVVIHGRIRAWYLCFTYGGSDVTIA